MSKAIIAIFSGTGNAMRAGGLLATELGAGGYDVGSVDLSAGEPIPSLGAQDLLVICSSTLGFSPPSTVMQRLRAAPRSSGTKVTMLCVCGGVMREGKLSGGWSGAASIVALSILRRKGYMPIGSADASYPENWTQITEAAKGDDRTAIIARGDADTRSFGKALIEGRSVFLKRNILTRSGGRFIAFIFRLLVRRILSSTFIADDSCSSCGLCAAICPDQTIIMKEGIPSWTKSCSSCNRCINACPSASIQTSTARLVIFVALNVVVLLASQPLARAVLGSLGLPAEGFLASLAITLGGIALYAAFTILQLGPVSSLLRLLERKPALRRLFTANFTGRYTRYLAPGFKPGAHKGS